MGCVPTLFFGRGLLKQEGTLAKIRATAERVASAAGLELIDVDQRRERGRLVVCLFVDREGGIGVDQLQSVSEEVSAILDAEDPVTEPYTLEVSSPGLDRPVKTAADFQRFVGRLARIASYELVDGRRHWVGRIVSMDDGSVSLALEKEGISARVPLAKISHARLEVEFPAKKI